MREPDLQTQRGRAWRVYPPPPAERELTDATIGAWIVNQPGVHPHWEYWMVAAIHLRDLPGQPPAKRHFPEATHEFLAVTMNPEKPPPDPDDTSTFAYLTPPDLVRQIAGIEDEQVSAVLDGMVRYALEGHAAFDSDFRSVWEALISNTVQHLVHGHHPGKA